MSTTTDHRSWYVARTLAGAIGGWFAVLALVTVWAEPTRDAIVFGRPQQTLALLSGTDSRLIASGATYLVVRGTEPGFVRALYGNGAWLVLPARGKSCLDLGRKPA